MLSCYLDTPLRRVVAVVTLLNLAGFAIEFAVALSIGSVFADSVDFLEDASVNIFIPIALGWSATARSRVGMLLALILMAPAVATLWTAPALGRSRSTATGLPRAYRRRRLGPTISSVPICSLSLATTAAGRSSAISLAIARKRKTAMFTIPVASV